MVFMRDPLNRLPHLLPRAAGKKVLAEIALRPAPRAVFATAVLLSLLAASCASMRAPHQPAAAGFRHSAYGPPHEPGPEYWGNVGLEMARRFDGAVPTTVWIVARRNHEGTLLNFPASPRDPLITPGTTDDNEAALQLFDRLGYRVWLQVEPGFASVDELMDLVLSRYGHHPSVTGFGIDVEWYRSPTPSEAEPVSDEKAAAWVAAVRRHNPAYRLFLKHWLVEKMPPTYRDGLLFIDDGQMLKNLDDLIADFKPWGAAFAPAPVGYQIGYRKDRKWWIRLDDPPRTIGRAIAAAIPNTESIFWVDFTSLEMFPPPTHPRDASLPTLAERLGYAREAKLLLIHADDLGAAASINAASTAAFAKGSISSASVMVPTPHFPAIAAWAREHPEADLGIHLTLTSEWIGGLKWGPVEPVESVPTLVDAEKHFHPLADIAVAHADLREIETELHTQVEEARSKGVRPTHFDNHMRTLESSPQVFEIMLRLSREYALPVAIPASFLERADLAPLLRNEDIVIDRSYTIQPEVPPEKWEEWYTNLVANLEPGVTELVVHLSYDDEETRAMTNGKVPWGAAWRQRDYDVLTSDRFRELLQQHDVKLITWREIGKVMPGWRPRP